MSDEDIQILEPPPPFPDLEEGEIFDSLEINVTAQDEIKDDSVMLVEDCDFVLDDEGLGISGDAEIMSEALSTSIAPVSLKFHSDTANNRRSGGCFNCGKAHNVMVCPDPIDSERILQNRRSFNDNNKMRETRITQNQHNKFHPGILSKYAREALGLRQDEYPPWIKRMRSEGILTGYPPGWLERLMPKTSKLEFFTEDPTLLNEKDEKMSSFKIDRSQIIYYEGFNDINPDLKAERRLRNEGYGIQSFSKEEYANRLENHVKRQFEQRLLEAARNEEGRKKKRRHPQNEEHGWKRENGKSETARSGENLYDLYVAGWISAEQLLKDVENGKVKLTGQQEREMRAAVENDMMFYKEEQKSNSTVSKVKSKAKKSKESTSFVSKEVNSIETQTDITLISNNILDEFREFLSRKGKQDPGIFMLDKSGIENNRVEPVVNKMKLDGKETSNESIKKDKKRNRQKCATEKSSKKFACNENELVNGKSDVQYAEFNAISIEFENIDLCEDNNKQNDKEVEKLLPAKEQKFEKFKSSKPGRSLAKLAITEIRKKGDEEMTHDQASRLRMLIKSDLNMEKPRKTKKGKIASSKPVESIPEKPPVIAEARLESTVSEIVPQTDQQNNNIVSTEMDVDSPASPTLPPVISKSLTYDQAKPEELIFPLVSDAHLPPANNWAQGITPFKHDNVIEGGSGLHRSIHQVLKSFSKDSK